jgi:hypothetical protein
VGAGSGAAAAGGAAGAADGAVAAGRTAGAVHAAAPGVAGALAALEVVRLAAAWEVEEGGAGGTVGARRVVFNGDGCRHTCS